MATVQKQEVTRYIVELTPAEASGLFTLISKGAAGSVLDDLGLTDLWKVFDSMNMPQKQYNFGQIATKVK